MTPETVITVAAFGKKAVNMRIPFEIPAECMKDHDIAGSVILVWFRLKTFLKLHWKRNERGSPGGSGSEGKIAEIFIYGKTQCRCGTLTSLKDILVVRSMEYLFPQVGQKRLWQRKGTNLKFPQLGQWYIAPPKEGSPQPNILSILSTSVFWDGEYI